MARFDPVDPRVRLAIAQWPPDAPRGAVSTFCLEHAISRKTFYAIRRRALEEMPGSQEREGIRGSMQAISAGGQRTATRTTARAATSIPVI